MTLSEFESKLNHWGQTQTPFLFLIDYEMERPCAWTIHEIPDSILVSINDFSNTHLNENKIFSDTINLSPQAISYDAYTRKFDYINKRILHGDSYLVNLTIKTPVELNCSLEEIFYRVKAKHKLFWKDQFLVFSPETFVQIKEGKIFTFPMKGTTDAAQPDAEKMLLNDGKEFSEHVTIVDLLRNDLSLVSSHVEVKRFRYVEKIITNHNSLLQVSSEIVGTLPDNYLSRLGSILISLLPAGSISGAPKKETIEIIKETEQEKQGYYTGVFGYFDGATLDSAVMIRFIEQQGNRYYYRSGGGITAQSDIAKEYQEVQEKIYVPVY